MFAILGSGFGLYGYLPALVRAGPAVPGCGGRVVLPERYRAAFTRRPELARHAAAVDWAVDEEAALSRADGAALALRPGDQAEWAGRCLAHPGIRTLVLEKPLACSPQASAALLARLAASGVAFRIGHNFRFTRWAAPLAGAVAAAEPGGLRIDWGFLAHHHRHGLATWKRDPAAGGGALRFYGIHLIALLAGFGYREVLGSRTAGAAPGECDAWEAAFAGPGLRVCTVRVDSRAATPLFAIAPADAPGRLVDLGDPYDQEGPGAGDPPDDRRVALLTRFLREPAGDPATAAQQVLDLWARVEAADRRQEPARG